VYIIAPVDKYIFYKEQFPQLIHIPLHKLYRDSVNPIKDINLTLELYKIYRDIRPDIILHYTIKPNIYGGIAAGLVRIPSIAVVTGLGYAFIHKGLIKIGTKRLYKISSLFHRKFIFENQDDLALFKDLKLIKPTQGISIKGCGVDADHFKPIKRIKANDKLIFTFIGRLIYDKGIYEYVKAAELIKKKYSNVEFWIIGEIDNNNPAKIKEKDLLEWVEQKTIIYQGFKENIKKYIAASDCIVLPSYREAIARTISEGMAMEKPIIATETPGCREAIENGKNGYLVPIKEINSLAVAIEKIINLTDGERTKMGKYGRAKVLKEFEDKLIVNHLYKIILNEIQEK